MDGEKEKDPRFVREIGGFRLSWEEAGEDGGMPWLLIEAAGGQWNTRLRGDMAVTLMWRRFLEDADMEEILHGQLRAMQLVGTTILDPVCELFIHTLVLGNIHLMGKDSAAVTAFNDGRVEIAKKLMELTQTILPAMAEDVPVTDEERKMLDAMRTGLSVREEREKRDV